MKEHDASCDSHTPKKESESTHLLIHGGINCELTRTAKVYASRNSQQESHHGGLVMPRRESGFPSGVDRRNHHELP